jgi:hypothetical protein
MEQRRQFTREFKLEAVRLVKDRGVSAAQAAKDRIPISMGDARQGEQKHCATAATASNSF